jgi:hypothetical protein
MELEPLPSWIPSRGERRHLRHLAPIDHCLICLSSALCYRDHQMPPSATVGLSPSSNAASFSTAITSLVLPLHGEFQPHLTCPAHPSCSTSAYAADPEAPSPPARRRHPRHGSGERAVTTSRRAPHAPDWHGPLRLILAVGRDSMARPWARNGPRIVHSFIQFPNSFLNWISINSFKILKFLENRIQLRKIQNKFI